MNIEWNSDEVLGDYPAQFNNPNFQHTWSPIEEIIISRSHQKIIEKAKTEKLMPRERLMKAFYNKDEDLDRVPSCVDWTPPIGVRLFDTFCETPPIIHVRDIFDHPEIGFLSEVMWYARFRGDVLLTVTYTFGEELLTKKFRMVEHGPPLAVEGFAKTKEELEWFLENIPDSATRGLYPT